MIVVYILIILVTVLAVYSAIGTYQNQQDIKALTDVTKMVGINAKHICQILELLKEQGTVETKIDNPVVGVKLNLDGSWSEIRANDKQERR